MRAYRLAGDTEAADAEQRSLSKANVDEQRSAVLDADGSRALASGDVAAAIASYRAAIN
jgi:hypothetical protein